MNKWITQQLRIILGGTDAWDLNPDVLASAPCPYPPGHCFALLGSPRYSIIFMVALFVSDSCPLQDVASLVFQIYDIPLPSVYLISCLPSKSS